MDLSKRLSISYYKTIAAINEDHRVFLAQHTETGKIYIKKEMNVYSLPVYKYLHNNPIKGIPKIIEYYEENGKLTVIEEYISGQTLSEKIENKMLTPHLIGQYIIKLCEILEKLHGQKPALIHRDIKPSNIIITDYDNVLLLDFNAAKYSMPHPAKTSDTVLLGTQGYAAPEQYGFAESSPQTDIYSIGMVLKVAVESLPDKCKVFNRIIDKCTQMDPSKRYRSVNQLKSAILMVTELNTVKDSDTTVIFPFLPPGFRTMTPWKMVIAIPAYIMVFFISLSFEAENISGNKLWFERFSTLFIFLVDILVGYNYLGVQNLFPPCRSSDKRIHALSVFILLFILTVSLAIILVIIQLAIPE